jgi:hypothetical protein
MCARRSLTVEDVPSIDITEWRRLDFLPSGGAFVADLASAFQSIGHISGVIDGLHVNATAWTPCGPVRSELRLLWTACNYGNGRYWFQCPTCAARFTKLYFLRRRFSCRRCHGLPYKSQRLPKSKTAVWKLRQLRRRLRALGWLCIATTQEKPPRMHITTYCMLIGTLVQLGAAVTAGWRTQLERQSSR